MKTPHKKNSTDWADISHEIERTYTYPDGSVFTIRNPIALRVSEDSGNHRVLAEDEDGTLRSIYVKNTWRTLDWTVEPYARPFNSFGPEAQMQFGIMSGEIGGQGLLDLFSDAGAIGEEFGQPPMPDDGESEDTHTCSVCGEELAV
jgi:hypothetical protein